MQAFTIERDRRSRARFDSDFQITPRSWFSYAVTGVGHWPWSEAKSALRSNRHLLVSDVTHFLKCIDEVHALVTDSLADPTPTKLAATIDRMHDMGMSFEAWTSMTVTNFDTGRPHVALFFRRLEDAAMFRMIYED